MNKIKTLIGTAVAAVLLVGVVAIAEDWGKPVTGTFVGSATIDLNQAQYQTLKYIVLGSLTANGGGNVYTAWLETSRGTLSVSNLILSTTITADATTNARSALLTEFVQRGDSLHIGNTNSPATNEYFLIFSDIKN